MGFPNFVLEVFLVVEIIFIGIIKITRQLKYENNIILIIAHNTPVLFVGHIFLAFFGCIMKNAEVLYKWYLVGFILSLGFILTEVSDLHSYETENILKHERLQSKILKKQLKTQEPFIWKLLEEIETLKKDCEDKERSLKKTESLLIQMKNNEQAYFDILEKYNNLKNTKENKKYR